MSETPRRILLLTTGGLPDESLLAGFAVSTGATEIFPLTEETAHAALEKIFAADTILVWGNLQG